MNLDELVSLYKNESKKVFESIPNDKILEFVKIIFNAYEGERKIFACGNGGNVAYIENFVVDFNMHPFVSDNKTEKFKGIRNNFHAVNLCNSAGTITGISNDLGYEHIFSEQLMYQACKNDVLFGISGSGNSKNIIKAMEVAKTKNMKTVIITRNENCKAKDIADLLIVVPGVSNFPGQIGN
jgi:D-sedoheptulose 7-phosphate isomerase